MTRSIGDERTQAGGGGSFEEEAAGTLIGGRHQVVGLIGRGGMGAVYRCLDVQLGREVAVKRLLAASKGSRAGIERFQREAKAVASLNHRNIVAIHDQGEDGRGLYLVMELLRGQDLGTAVKEGGKLEEEEVLEVFRQVAAALSYAHRKRVVHRDIKPSNLYRLEDGTVKVLDFGLARMGTESQLSMEGFGMGTLDYVSPEQKRDATQVDHRSDLFSLGGTLYHLSTGRSPQTIRERELPESLREPILKMMEDRPEDRYFTVDEALAAVGKPQAAREPAARREGGCPGCGVENPPEARFCEGCGTGLFEKCPSCDVEGRSGRRFCPRCGTNIPDYKQAEEHAKRAGEHEKARAWSRAEKEWTEALRVKPGWANALRGLETSRVSTARLSEAMKQGRLAMESRDLQGLRAALGEIKGLSAGGDSVVESLEARLTELSAQCSAAEANRNRGVTFLEFGKLKEAEEALAEAERAWPGTPEVQQLSNRVQAALKQHSETIREARRALEAGDLSAWESVRKRLDAQGVKDPEVANLRTIAKDLRKLRDAAQAEIKHARGYLVRGRLEEAEARLRNAISLWPESALVAGLGTELEKVRESVSSLEKRFREALEHGDLGLAEDAITSIRSLIPEADLITVLDGALTEARSKYEEERRSREAIAAEETERAEKALAAGNFDEAKRRTTLALEALPDSSVARHLMERVDITDREVREAHSQGLEALGSWDLAKAQEKLDFLESIAPNHPRTKGLAVELSRAREAAQSIQNAMERCRTSLKQGRLADAEASFQSAERLSSGDPEVARLGRSISMQRNRLASEMSVARKATLEKDENGLASAISRLETLLPPEDDEIAIFAIRLAEIRGKNRRWRWGVSIAGICLAIAGFCMIPGVVEFSALPEDVRVFIDGRIVSRSSGRVHVSLGGHRIGLSRPGHRHIGDRSVTVLPLMTETVPNPSWDTAGIRPAVPGLEPPPDPPLGMQLDLCLPEGLACTRDGRIYSEVDGAELVLIPGGETTIGSNGAGIEERPAHRVSISPFLMDRHEVTGSQYGEFCEKTGRKMPRPAEGEGGRLPVVNIDWSDASAYSTWAGRRLPTEAEWERAARGEANRVYPWGAEDDVKRRNGLGGQDGHFGLSPAGAFLSGEGPFGTLDMAGNASEWCFDWFDSSFYNRAQSSGPNPRGPDEGTYRVVRGGSYLDNGQDLHASKRFLVAPNSKLPYLGFRTVVGVSGR
jgi:formylglycine-generating enzyme required for sulfatase activity/serine/threonine protein kinase